MSMLDAYQTRRRLAIPNKVYSLWTEDERANPYTGLPPKDHFVRIYKFIRELGQQAYQVEKVFKGLLGILRASVITKTDSAKNLSSKPNPWLKYIPEYQKALRKADTSNES